MLSVTEFEEMQAEAHKYYTIYDAGELISEIGIEEFMQNVIYSVENPDELVRIVAEVCYGWQIDSRAITHRLQVRKLPGPYFVSKARMAQIKVSSFNPLAKTEAGRSQAIELMILFKIEVCFSSNEISYQIKNPKDTKQPYDWFEMSENLQKDICIACILTAQGMK